MKLKHACGVITVFMLWFLVMPCALAVSKYASEPVYMREGPGTKYNIILELQTGDEVNVIETSGNWSKVTFNGRTGYVFSKYLTSDKVSGANRATTTAKVNVRSGAGTNYKKLGSLKKGASIQIIKIEGNWASFMFNGKVAYVHKDYLSLKTSNGTDDVLKKLEDNKFYTNYANDIFGVITNSANTEVTIRISNTKKAAQLKTDLMKALAGLPYKIVQTSFPSYVDLAYLNDLSVSVFDKYNALTERQKSQYVITEAYYSATDDKFYVGIVDLDKTKEKLFKQQISSWSYITLVSLSDAPRPKV